MLLFINARNERPSQSTTINSNQNIKERHKTFNMTPECPQLRISQVGQKIPPIKLQDFFKRTNQWLQIGAPDQGRSVDSTSRSKIILTNQMTGFATLVDLNSCKNRCHLFQLTDAVALTGLCNWTTISKIIQALTANSGITGLLGKFYVGRMTTLTTPRSAPERKAL